MSQVLQLAVPEPGQLVDVRCRRYVVMDIPQSPLPPDILTPGAMLRQHLVTLSSVEDVALEDYQLDPFARAIQMPRVNLLIADDVGLGKIIEAGVMVRTIEYDNLAFFNKAKF